MRLSIIIVNYKTPLLLADCLRSVFEFDTEGIEVIVADNNSNDGSEEMVRSQFPSVIYIQLGYNAGFARANNAGIKIAKGENILLLNSDTINLNNAVSLCDEMLRKSTYSAAGVQLLNADRSPQISGSHVMKGGLNYLLPLPFTGKFLRFIALTFKAAKPSIENTNQTVEVDWINGAFLMVKKDAILKAGVLDEDFFLYAEEAEWCSRIKKTGRLCIFGELNVLHLQGESANTAFESKGKGYLNLFDRKGLQIMLSNLVRIRKELGVFWLLLNLGIFVLTIPVFLICLLFSKLFFIRNYSFSQFAGFTGNVFFVIKLLPVIIRNKPHFYKVL